MDYKIKKKEINKEINIDVMKGTSFPVLLTIIFIVLKLTNLIDWSWLWILSPIWVSAVILISFLGLVFLLATKGNNDPRN